MSLKNRINKLADRRDRYVARIFIGPRDVTEPERRAAFERYKMEHPEDVDVVLSPVPIKKTDTSRR